MSPYLAGLVAALPLAFLGIAYMLLRGRQFVSQLMAQDVGKGSDTTPNMMYWALLGGMALAPFAFGLLAGYVFTRLDNPSLFTEIALGAAVVLSLLALVAKPPVMKGFKIITNFAVALALGLLIPMLAGR